MDNSEASAEKNDDNVHGACAKTELSSTSVTNSSVTEQNASYCSDPDNFIGQLSSPANRSVRMCFCDSLEGLDVYGE